MSDLNPLTKNLLEVLRELDDDTLYSCYGINRYRVMAADTGIVATVDSATVDEEDHAPLDLALSKWRAAGCPDV